MSLRNTLIGLGVLVAILPHLGLPSWIDTLVATCSGLAIVFLLTLWDKVRARYETIEQTGATTSINKGEPRTLSVKRSGARDYSELPVEKES